MSSNYSESLSLPKSRRGRDITTVNYPQTNQQGLGTASPAAAPSLRTSCWMKTTTTIWATMIRRRLTPSWKTATTTARSTCSGCRKWRAGSRSAPPPNRCAQPALGPARRLCAGQPAVQYQRLVARQPGRRPALGVWHTAARQRQLVEPLLESILSNHEQAQTLTQLRDTLLPRLISGQLRLPEAMAEITKSTAQELQYAN